MKHPHTICLYLIVIILGAFNVFLTISVVTADARATKSEENMAECLASIDVIQKVGIAQFRELDKIRSWQDRDDQSDRVTAELIWLQMSKLENRFKGEKTDD